MSLINEALKKAQRSRSGDMENGAPVPGDNGPRITKRSQPRTSQQLVLIAAGAIVLVVLSVVATVYLVNRPPEPKPASATAPKPIAPASTPEATPPPLVAPVLNPPVLTTRPATETPPAVTQTLPTEKPSAAPAPAPAPAESKTVATAAPVVVTPPASSPAPKPTVATTPAPAPAQTSSAPVVTPPPAAPPPAVATATPPPVAAPAPTPAPTPAPAKADERVAAFIDAIRVAGIRNSGTESRVLMNDRVYRVNEIIDRASGLRITKVEANALTFTDANGVVYVKNF